KPASSITYLSFIKDIKIIHIYNTPYPKSYCSQIVLLKNIVVLLFVDPILIKKCFLERMGDRKSTRLNSSHVSISYAVFCLKKKKKDQYIYVHNNNIQKT